MSELSKVGERRARRPKCSCGCGGTTSGGPFLRGHNIRVPQAEREEFIDDFPGSAEDCAMMILLDGPKPSAEAIAHYADEMAALDAASQAEAKRVQAEMILNASSPARRRSPRSQARHE